VLGVVTADMIAERMRETVREGPFVPHAPEVDPSAIAADAVGGSADREPEPEPQAAGAP